MAYTAALIAEPATVDPTVPLAYLARVERLVALNQQTFAILA